MHSQRLSCTVVLPSSMSEKASKTKVWSIRKAYENEMGTRSHLAQIRVSIRKLSKLPAEHLSGRRSEGPHEPRISCG